MDNSLRKRRVTLPQLECLWKFLNSHRVIATGYNKCTSDRETSKRLWKGIALNLNAIDTGATKSWKDWNKYWNNYKSKLKLKIDAALKARKGNEPIDWDCLAEIEKKFIVILGKRYQAIIDGEMEVFKEAESSDDSLDSVYDPKTVPEIGTEMTAATDSPRPCLSDSPISQNSSVFQQMFVDEDSGDKSEVNGQSYASSNKLNSHNIVVKKEKRRDSTGSKSNSTGRYLQRGSARESTVWPQRQKAPQNPKRRQFHRSDTPLGLDNALSMLVRDSRRKTVLMETLLQEVIDIKELLIARLPPV